MLEGWTLTVLRAHNEEADLFEEIWYWAPVQARQTEVDFLLRRGKEHLALEVKAHSRFSAMQVTGLRAIGDLDRVVRRVLLYLGDRRLRTDDGVGCGPCARSWRPLLLISSGHNLVDRFRACNGASDIKDRLRYR